jgi:hypothetical protein
VLPFPPSGAIAVAISIDGHPVCAYLQAYLLDGRVFAPVSPLLTRLADRIWLEGNRLIVQRSGRSVTIVLLARPQQNLSGIFVAAGPLLRRLGEGVRYDAREHRLDVTTPVATVATPSPFNPAAPSAAPAQVFTPAPVPTPRPVWTGTPLPRRTPIAAPSP